MGLEYAPTAGWTIGWIGNRIIASSLSASIELHLETAVGSSMIDSLLASEHGAGWSEEDWVDARTALADAGAITGIKQESTRTMPSDVVPPGLIVVSLGDVLTTGALESRQPRVVTTAPEVLFLPAHMQVGHARKALRMFASGMKPPNRSAMYGALITGAGGIAWDIPPSALLATVAGFTQDVLEPFVVSWDGTEATLQTDEAVADIAVVGRLHPVQELELATDATGPVSLVSAAARYASPNLRHVDASSPKYGGASSTDVDGAKVRATAEALERFAAGDVAGDRVRLCAAVELAEHFINPNEVVAFLPQQLEEHDDLNPFEPSEPRLWTKGTTQDGNETWVLADLVYYPLSYPTGNRHAKHSPANSSGVAAAATAAEADRRAYLELVERDAFMRIWLSRTSQPRISLSSLRGETAQLVNWVRQRGWSVELVDASQLNAGVVLAVGFDEARLILGAAAGRNSAHRAMLELAAAALGADVMPVDTPSDAHAVRSPRDHRLFYSFGQYAPTLEFLWSGRVESTEAQTEDEPKELPSHVVSVDLTSELTEPLSVRRCIAAGLIPITFGHGREPLGLDAVQDILSPRSPWGIWVMMSVVNGSLVWIWWSVVAHMVRTLACSVRNGSKDTLPISWWMRAWAWRSVMSPKTNRTCGRLGYRRCQSNGGRWAWPSWTGGR